MDLSLPLGWRTDLAVLELGGSQIEEHDDHLVVRTPANPTFFWGNFVLATDPLAIEQPDHWLAVFESAFPTAEHRAIGLVAAPDRDLWLERTLFLEVADVLVSRSPVAPGPLADGYSVRELTTGEDWDQSTALRRRTYPGEEDFAARSTASRARTAELGLSPWFGAFAGDTLVAELGIALLGDRTARYRSVLTDAQHRRRGLTRHLLGVAAEYAYAHEASTLVIIADGGTDAGRLYRSAGFALDGPAYQVSRMPGIAPL